MRMQKKSLLILLLVLWSTISLFLFFGFSSYFNFTTNPENSIFGYQFGVMTGRYIHLPLTKDDVYILRVCSPEDVKPGDIVRMKVEIPTNSNKSNSKIRIIAEPCTREVMQIITEQHGEKGLWFVTTYPTRSSEDIVPADRLIGKIVGRIPNMRSYVTSKPLTSIIRLCIRAFTVLVVIAIALRWKRKKHRKKVGNQNDNT